MPSVKSTLSIAMPSAVCLAIGFFAGQQWPQNNSSIIETNQIAPIQTPIDKSQTTPIATNTQSSLNLTNEIAAQAPPEHLTELPNNAQPLPASTDMMHENPSTSVTELVAKIRAISPDIFAPEAIEELANTEGELLTMINSSGASVQSLLDVYANFHDESTKDLLRSALATSDLPGLESAAMEMLVGANAEDKLQWLELLGAKSVSDSDVRNKLLSELDLITDPAAMVHGIRALAPQPASSSDKQTVVNQLTQYLYNEDESVRTSAIETLALWVDKDQSYFIEGALEDDSNYIKNAAIHAAFQSGIQSEVIKSRLLEIMQDETASQDMRSQAFYALSSYTLHGIENDSYFRFHQSISNVDDGSAKG